MSKTYRRSVTLPEDLKDALEKIAAQKNVSVSSLVREYIEKGLQVDKTKEDVDFIREQIREELNIILKPAIERLASLEVKGGMMSAASFYLLEEIIIAVLTPDERKRMELTAEDSRKKAAAYYKNSRKE